MSTDCDTSVNYNQGCGTRFRSSKSYGQGFNAANGGWYVMEKSANEGINIWFWSRKDTTVPDEVRKGSDSLSPSIDEWGLPDAQFPVASCDYGSHFDAHAIIFDLTLCVSGLCLLTYEPFGLCVYIGRLGRIDVGSIGMRWTVLCRL